MIPTNEARFKLRRPAHSLVALTGLFATEVVLGPRLPRETGGEGSLRLGSPGHLPPTPEGRSRDGWAACTLKRRRQRALDAVSAVGYISIRGEMRKPPEPLVNVAVAIAKALADETRVRIVMALDDDELCLCQLVAWLELAPSTVSKHLAVLVQAGLVRRRKQGRWHYFSLARGKASEPALGALAWLRRALAADPRIRDDRRRIARIRRLDLEACCEHYR